MKRLCMLLLVAVACDSDSAEAPVVAEGIVFGHYYGMCFGEHCVEIFKLTGEAVYEDQRDAYPNYLSAYEGDYVKLDASKFAAVKSLKDEIPPALLSVTQTVIGEPDAGDWGGLYFEMTYQGEKRYWLIDKMDANLPDNLIPFKHKLEDHIHALSQ